MKNQDKLFALRHTCEHVLTQAMQELYGKEKIIPAMGPATNEGFYFDFDTIEDFKISEKDFPKIEKRMKKIIQRNLPLVHKEVNLEEGRKIFDGNDYKLEWIEKFAGEGSPLSIYETGDQFVDLCAGPHVEKTGEIKAFKLLKIAGAYWHGDENNKMLVRIYGIAFEKKEELEDYLYMLEESKKRDHRKLGKELDLFSFHKEGHGFPFWHPKGTELYLNVEQFVREENKKRDYTEIKTPMILNKDLWVTSGHWEKFKDNMYFTNIDDVEHAVKPMNCPGGLLVFNNSNHSYRELPIRRAEFGYVHRHEKSGVLYGLFRVRAFTQDDAHSFCTPEQLNSEIIDMVEYAIDLYKTFGFYEYEIFIATKPEKYIGNDEDWEKATNALTESLKEKGLDYKIKEGEGAFYGPKIEFNIKDCLKRNWQCGTIQVDFSMPERFGATYVDSGGEKKTPVMIHRAIVGSLERFIGIVIENFAGAFPLWLAPEQIVIIPVADKFIDYAENIQEKLKEEGFRVRIDSSNESLGKKIRNAEKMKIPRMLVVGEKEVNEQSLSVRNYFTKEQEDFSVEDFIKEVQDKIINKTMENGKS